MKALVRLSRRLRAHITTLEAIFSHFSSTERAFLLPLLVVLLLAGLLLLLSTGVGYVTPFVYTAF
jgi:hypothetical protein